MPSRILLVDDNARIRQSLRQALESRGFSVCGEAENGKDAVEKVQALSPDAVILDLSMPVMNGLQAARAMQKLVPDVPLLMYTSYTNASLAGEARAAGVKTVVDKADSLEVLEEGLRGLLSPSS